MRKDQMVLDVAKDRATQLLAGVIVAVACTTTLSGQASMALVAVDTAKIGPQVGSIIPAFSGVDQSGRTQTLESLSGPKGLMLVFNRSADW